MATLAALFVFVAVIACAVWAATVAGSYAWRYQREFQRESTRKDPIARVFFPAHYTSPFPWHRQNEPTRHKQAS